MAGVYGDINSRVDFLTTLSKATDEGKKLLAKQPGHPTIEAIVRELEAIAFWCTDGHSPTEEQRESIGIGVPASREFEGDDQVYSWTRDLFALDAYVEDWPSDEKATSATDDDFFNGD